MSIVARPRTSADDALVVAEYRRVSTLDQLDGFGLEDQHQVCNGWMDRHPEATLYDGYMDEGVSGALERRPGMDRLILDAHKGHINRILVAGVDRIGRTARAAYQWAWNMQDIDVYFIAVQENIDTSTEAGWHAFSRYVQFSEMEWRRIRERTSAGRDLKMSYGGWPGGPPPYGYKLINDATVVDNRKKKFSVLVTNEWESAVLALAVSFLVDKGLNITEAAAELNRLGRYTRSGVPWTTANLRNRLHAETIHDGYVLYRKANRSAEANTIVRHEDGTPLHGDAVRIGVPRIFTEQRAAELMESLRRTGFQNGRQGNRVYPLSGRILGKCGESYTGSGQGMSGSRMYRCKGILQGRRDSCGEPHFDADAIEKAVWQEIATLLRNEPRLKAITLERAETLRGDKAKYAERVLDLQARIAELERLIRQKVPEYIEADIDPKVMKAAVDKMNEDLKECKEKHFFAREWLERYAEHERESYSLVDTAQNGGDRFKVMTLEERREVFDMLNVQVVPGDMAHTRKPGVRCAVSEWHWETGTKVPHEPTDEEWETVLEVVLPFFTKRHFTSKYDIRKQFAGMLYRLRHGLAWVDMPETWGPVNAIRERQLAWWQKGAWPMVMHALKANEQGVQAYRRPTLPELKVTGQLPAGLLTEAPCRRP